MLVGAALWLAVLLCVLAAQFANFATGMAVIVLGGAALAVLALVACLAWHCKLWREPKQRAPPPTQPAPQPRELTYDPGFFDRECA